jgi:hypothetical protein
MLIDLLVPAMDGSKIIPPQFESFEVPEVLLVAEGEPVTDRCNAPRSRCKKETY